MADADSVLEAAEFASVFLENVGIPFLSSVVSCTCRFTYRRHGKALWARILAGPTGWVSISPSGAVSCEDSSSQDSGVVVLSS